MLLRNNHIRPLRTIVVEDEPSARNGMVRMLDQYYEVNVVGEAFDLDSMNALIKSTKPDLVLLDIMLRDENSMEAIKSLKISPLLIMTTAFDSYALKSFELKTVDYLMKPIPPARLKTAIQKAYTIHCANGEDLDSLFIKSGRRLVRIKLDDILFIKALQNYVVFHTKEAKYMCKITMKEVGLTLWQNNFIKTHKSYIVNVNNIDSFEKSSLYFGEYELPVSRTIKPQLYQLLVNGLPHI